jgi:hypothetical protein
VRRRKGMEVRAYQIPGELDLWVVRRSVMKVKLGLGFEKSEGESRET